MCEYFQLHAIADIVESSGDQHSILRALFFQIEPDTLILKYNLDEERLRVINQLIGLVPSNNAKERNVGSHYDDEEVDQFSLSESDEDGRLFNDEFYNVSGRRQQPSVGCRLHFVPSSFFKIEVAKRKLMSLHLQSQLAFTTETERHIYMKSTFPLECPAVVQVINSFCKSFLKFCFQYFYYFLQYFICRFSALILTGNRSFIASTGTMESGSRYRAFE